MVQSEGQVDADSPAAADRFLRGNTEISPWMEGLAGTVNGSFFAAPRWIDLQKAPGTTSQLHEVRNAPKWASLLSGTFLFYSPNLVWLTIALGVYFIFPYDLDAARSWDLSWFLQRCILNASLVLLFFGFWHVALYVLGWASRPFQPDRSYRYSKLAHNVWYSLLGALQWTVWEIAVCHCYATGSLSYVSDKESFSSIGGIAQFVVWFFVVPLWREMQFYFAHRLIHLKPLYKYVHSLHHRNTDTEPFSGLCMHPIEHLFYFSSVGPSLFLRAPPIAFLWNGIHCLLAPAASHSGFEDHWQADQMHYLHHRFLECNYGTPTFPLDLIFGTFRERLSSSSSAYTGSAASINSNEAASIDAKASLLGLPTWDQTLFNILVSLPIALTASLAVHGDFLLPLPFALPLSVSSFSVGVLPGDFALALLVVTFPLLVGSGLLLLTRRQTATWSQMLLAPFHRENWVGVLGFHLLVGTLVGVLPVVWLIQMVLAPEPSRSIHHVLLQLVG